jgi:hypothetical protein
MGCLFEMDGMCPHFDRQSVTVKITRKTTRDMSIENSASSRIEILEQHIIHMDIRPGTEAVVYFTMIKYTGNANFVPKKSGPSYQPAAAEFSTGDEGI